jgi:hypothetical protein
MAPTVTPQIISMEFSNGKDNSYFRILAGALVKYLVILPGALEHSALLDMPLEFMTILPPMNYGDATWTMAHISHDPATGQLTAALSSPTMAQVSNVWHPTRVDFVELDYLEGLGLLAGLYIWASGGAQGGHRSTGSADSTVIAKMARFEWEIPYVERETRIYQRLEGTGLAPRFVGHVHEQGRVAGFLVEYVEGRHAGIQDLAGCRAALDGLHRLGVLHGDANRYNFIVGSDGEVRMIDFDQAREGASIWELEAEMAGLEAQLLEETGRGGGFECSEDGDEERDD